MPNNTNNLPEVVSDILRNHNDELRLFKIAIASSVATLMYSEFLSNFLKTTRPVLRISVPETVHIEKLLQPGNPFANKLADGLINMMNDNRLFQENRDVPELTIFSEEYADALHIILESHIIPNISTQVPAMIRAKFGLDIDTDRTFYESSELDIFGGGMPEDYHHKFIADQTVLQLLMSIPSTSYGLSEYSNNSNITIVAANPADVLSIGHQNAITVIHFNEDIISNAPMMELLSFVTDSQFTLQLNDGVCYYHIRSNAFNQLIKGTIRRADYSQD